MKLNVNMFMLIKNMKCVESNAKIVSAILNTQTVAKNSNRYEYMDDWKKFNETTRERTVYSHANTEGITDADYTHEKRVFKDCKIKNLEIFMFEVIHCC